MEALKNLDLGGQLQLRKLENATGADAKAAKLWDKKKLEELTLSWTRNNGDKEAHEEVLEGLRPHDGLKALRMYCCRSSGIPTWMLELQGMVELKLENCQNLEKLPALWQLQSLQFLYLSNLGNLRCLFSGGAPSKFQKLKMIGLVDMPNFEMWWDRNEVQGEEQIFPEAENLRIVLCQKLLALPKASVIKKSSGRDGVECRSPFPALKGMLLSGLDKFHRWEAVQGSLGEQVTFPSLEQLKVFGCPVLTTFPEAPKLRKVELLDCRQQASLQAGSRYITSLSNLVV
jgi:hypothetical protein